MSDDDNLPRSPTSSVANNEDANSQKDDFLEGQAEFNNRDFLADNYESQLQMKYPPDNNDQNQPLLVDNAFTSAEVYQILHIGSESNRYEKVLDWIVDETFDLPEKSVQEWVKIIMTKSYISGRETIQLVKNAIFLFKLIKKMGQHPIIERYYPISMEIMNNKHPYYTSFYSPEDFTKNLMKLAEQMENSQIIEEVYSWYEQAHSNARKIKEKPELGQILWNLSMMWLQNTLLLFSQKSKLNTCFVLSRVADPNQKNNLIEKHQNILSLTGSEYNQMAKGQLEQYCHNLIDLTSSSEDYCKKYLFSMILRNLHEDNSIEKKALAFKMIVQCINAAKVRSFLSQWLLNWLIDQNILAKYLRDDTHHQILRKLPPIVRFLYEKESIDNAFMIRVIIESLHCHEEMFKVIQSLVVCLRVSHLEEVFENIVSFQDFESNHFVNLLSTIVSNPNLNELSTRKKKNVGMKLPLRLNASFDFENEQQPVGEQIQSEDMKRVERLVMRLFLLLVKLIEDSQTLYINILNKLISSQFKVLKDTIDQQILNLFRNNKTCALWLIQHCLKIDMTKQKGTHTNKYQFLSKLINEGLNEYLLAMLARNRYNKVICDKIINVIILVCRFYKPLEKHQIEFIWKVLGLKSRDERERQQFFSFLKEILRYENSLTEECVNYIFFEILMRQHVDWFSLRVYDCLEVLFMRLNQDCKLLNYQNQQYEIKNPELIGIDKFWYIYFNVQEPKVIKKCKEFLWKLSTFACLLKPEFHHSIMLTIIRYLSHCLQLPNQLELQRKSIIFRGFDMIEKMMQEKKEDFYQKDQAKLTLIIDNHTENSVPPKKKSLEVLDKMTLQELRAAIIEQMNIANKNLQMMTKGKLINGQKMTLKQLGIETNQTIIVHDAHQGDDVKKISKSQIKNQIIEILSGQFEDKFIDFIAQKYEGEQMPKIMDSLFDETKMHQIKQQFESNSEKEENIIKLEMVAENVEDNVEKVIVEEKPIRKFGEIVSEDTQNFEVLLQCCASVGNQKRTWDLIKKLPVNSAKMKQISSKIESGEWDELFKNKKIVEWIYILIILNHYIRASNINKEKAFELNGLRLFLMNTLQRLIETNSEEYLIYDEILKIYLLSIPSSALSNFDNFLVKKPLGGCPDLGGIEGTYMEEEVTYKSYITDGLFSSIFTFIKDKDVPEAVITSFLKVYLHSLHHPQDSNQFSMFCLNQQVIYNLLLKYGRPIEYCLAFSLFFYKRKDPQAFQHHLSRLTENVAKFIIIEPHKECNLKYLCFYNFLESIVKQSCYSRHGNFEKSTAFALMEQMRDETSVMTQEELIGYNKILFVLLMKLMKNEKEFLEREQKFYQFARWLFNQYLFELNHPKPYFRVKDIRKLSYDILFLLSENQHINLLIHQSVVQVSVSPRLQEDQNVDFKEQEFIGLRNLGATCYINSLLQQLYHTKLSQFILEEDTQGNPNEIKMLELKKIFLNLFLSIKNVVNPRSFIKSIKFYGEDINPSVQQDATEFLMCLLDYIENISGKQTIETIFGGTLSNEIVGLQQQSEFTKSNQEHFNTLSIDIKGKKNLQEALIYFTKGQVLDGENMYYCDELQRKTKAMKKTSLDQLPNILVLTLKRFQFDYETMTRHKLNDYFQFPIQLDLARYCTNAQKEKAEINPNQCKFKLAGILIHSGSAESGHYYSYIKVKEKWYQFNDKHVSEFNLQANLKSECFGGSDEKNKNAYMLFYEKYDCNYHGVHLNDLPNDHKVSSIIHEENQCFIKNRLVYDLNYIEFLKKLENRDDSEEINKILNILCPKKQDQVHFNVMDEELQPLISLTDHNHEGFEPRDQMNVELMNFTEEQKIGPPLIDLIEKLDQKDQGL